MTESATDPALTARNLDPAAFPEHDPLAEQLAFLVRYAVLAPSGHNTQPWRFELRGGVPEPWADRHGPSRPRTVPTGTARSSPSSATTEPNRLLRPSASMTAVTSVHLQ